MNPRARKLLSWVTTQLLQHKIEVIAVLLIVWRVASPKGSHNTLYDLAEFLTTSVVDWGWGNNIINIILVDNFNEVLMGVFVRVVLVAFGSLFLMGFVFLKNRVTKSNKDKGAAS